MDFAHLNKIQSVMDASVKNKEVAGLNVLIFKDDKEAAYFESGYKDIKNKSSFSRDTICRLYSMSKPVTAVAAMILVEQGLLDLATDISEYIPSFKNLTVSYEKGSVKKASGKITVQDLLNMTSGYTYGAWSEDCPKGEHLTSQLIQKLNKDCLGERKISTLDVANLLSQIPVSFEPGTDYSYGLSADILGAVIEVVSKMKFSEFLKKNIFDPLKMNDTAFYVPQEKQGRLSKVYQLSDDNLKEFTNPNLGIQPFMDHEPSFESGGAGLCSTIDDYMKFASMLCNKGQLNNTRILQEKTVEFLTSARLIPNLQQRFDMRMPHLSGYTYCNLLRVAINKGQCKAITENDEFGWDGWLGPYVSVDLKNHLTVVMLMQKTDSGTWSLTRKIKNIIYTSL